MPKSEKRADLPWTHLRKDLVEGWQPDLVGARAQSVPMSMWRTSWQQGRFALDSLCQLLRGTSVVLAMPPVTNL
jgi:hypothetical protein